MGAGPDWLCGKPPPHLHHPPGVQDSFSPGLRLSAAGGRRRGGEDAGTEGPTKESGRRGDGHPPERMPREGRRLPRYGGGGSLMTNAGGMGLKGDERKMNANGMKDER